MSEIKDKRIFIYEIVAKRDTHGNEIKAKKYIHPRIGLWAYVREMSEREKFSAKAAGAELTTVFKVNYNNKIKAGQYLEFNGDTFLIESVDGFQYYKRDITLNAKRIVPETAVYDEYDEL
jgi:SPP1 family predicted phage head-tail adaptor